MKNIKYTFLAAALAFGVVACSPMEDINDTLESEYTGPVENDLTYTLTPSDYVTISTQAKLEAITTEEFEMATQIAADTVLYPDYAAKYGALILNKQSALLGYGVGTALNMTYNYASAIGGEVSEKTELFDVKSSMQWGVSTIVNVSAFTGQKTVAVGETDEFTQFTRIIAADPELGKYCYKDKYETEEEVYYGSSPYNANFDCTTRFRLTGDVVTYNDGVVDPVLKALETDPEGFLAECVSRIGEAVNIMLQIRYAESGAAIESNGSAITYKVRQAIYTGSTQYVICTYKCTKASPAPAFELLEDPYIE
ncbi:MAG: hypothetical protein ACK5JS_02130 [Mangrovibacterium sp.]